MGYQQIPLESFTPYRRAFPVPESAIDVFGFL
jgi:hypothetical protein